MIKKSILIIGANSEISKELAKKFAQKGFDIYLALRNKNRLFTFKKNLAKEFNIMVRLFELDILDPPSFQKFFDELGHVPEIAVCNIGIMRDLSPDKEAPLSSLITFNTNFSGPAVFLLYLAKYFRVRGSGVIVATSSVAGDRGRYSNFIYGSSKAGLTNFLSGLRASLHDDNIHVISIVPGFIKTKMLGDKKVPWFLLATPEMTAESIVKAIERKRNVVYVRSVWFFIMLVIKMLPEILMKRLKI